MKSVALSFCVIVLAAMLCTGNASAGMLCRCSGDSVGVVSPDFTFEDSDFAASVRPAVVVKSVRRCHDVSGRSVRRLQPGGVYILNGRKYRHG